MYRLAHVPRANQLLFFIRDGSFIGQVMININRAYSYINLIYIHVYYNFM